MNNDNYKREQIESIVGRAIRNSTPITRTELNGLIDEYVPFNLFRMIAIQIIIVSSIFIVHDLLRLNYELPALFLAIVLCALYPMLLPPRNSQIMESLGLNSTNYDLEFFKQFEKVNINYVEKVLAERLITQAEKELLIKN